MEENNNENTNNEVKEEVKKKNNIGFIVILMIIVLAIGACGGYLLSKNLNSEKTTAVVENNQIQDKNETVENRTKQKYTTTLTDAQNGKTAFIELESKSGLQTEKHDGYYTYVDPFNNKYNIKEIKDVVSEKGMLGNDKQTSLFKVTVKYIDNNNKTKTMILAIILLPNHEVQNMGTYDNYTGSTSFVKSFTELYEEAEIEPENAVEGLSSIKVSEIESKIKELKADGYEEIEIKNSLNELAKSNNPNYKYSLTWNYDQVMNIKENGEMVVNGKNTGYKYKDCLGIEFGKAIVTEDNYLYSLETLDIMVNSKIKVILRNDNIFGNLSQTKVIFEDGHMYEYGAC